MRLPRLLSIAVLLAGVIAGTATDNTRSVESRQAGGYVLLAADFHVHAFPGDGALSPWALRDEAARRGLDVIAITNHNLTITGRLAQWLAARSDGPLMIAGEEVTSPGYHLIALGIDRTVPGGRPAAAAIDAVHAEHGVAIAAHPTLRTIGWDTAAMARLDGAETAHPATDAETQEFHDFFDAARQHSPHLAPIGSSDFHATPVFGCCRTIVFARARTREAVLDAVRSGRTVSIDARGRRVGEPSLIQLLDRAGGPTLPDHSAARPWAVIMSAAGLFGLLIFA